MLNNSCIRASKTAAQEKYKEAHKEVRNNIREDKKAQEAEWRERQFQLNRNCLTVPLHQRGQIYQLQSQILTSALTDQAGGTFREPLVPQRTEKPWHRWSTAEAIKAVV